MFESDQHEFDEEYAEVSHPAPPSPAKPFAGTQPAAATTFSPPATTTFNPGATNFRTAAPASPVAAANPVATAKPVAPASPPAPARPAAAPVAPVAVHEPIVEEAQEDEYEDPEFEDGEQEEYVDAAEKPELEPPQKKKPNLVLIGGVGGLVLFALLVMLTLRPKSNPGPPPGDLGPGIVAVAGLRGHLDTRWDGDGKTGRLSYKLLIEPMEDRWAAGFSKAVTASPMPMYANIRLLDSTGFALCGKEIEFRFDPQNAGVQVTVSPVGANGKKLSLAERNAAIEVARQAQVAQMQAAEATRLKGKDIFQNQTTDEGQVKAVNVQGTLPCSPDQYRHTDYWDFNTNFPTLDQQAALVDPKAGQHAKELTPPAHPEKRTLTKWGDGFVIQGDDRVTGYDSARGLLWAEQKTFAIDKRYGQATASAWASNYTLIHYKCDQHANCALTAAGQVAVLHARMNE